MTISLVFNSWLDWIIGLFVVVLILAVALPVGLHYKNKNALEDLEKKLSEGKYILSEEQLKKLANLEKLEKRIDELEKKITKSVQTASKGVGPTEDKGIQADVPTEDTKTQTDLLGRYNNILQRHDQEGDDFALHQEKKQNVLDEIKKRNN